MTKVEEQAIETYLQRARFMLRANQDKNTDIENVQTKLRNLGVAIGDLQAVGDIIDQMRGEDHGDR